MTVASIQRRLFLLLLRAFSAMVLLIVVLLLVIIGVWLSIPSRVNPFTQLPIFAALETYYLTHGNWDGVETLFEANAISPLANLPSNWERSLLLDETGRVVMDRGRGDTSLVGTIYHPSPGDALIPLTVRGVRVGEVVYGPSELSHPLRIIFRLLEPVAFLSILPAILTLIIGLLLTRRVVAPLSEVIAAAQRVATGDLSARVKVEGPDDLRALSDSFNHMADALEQADHQRRNLLADIAHELRTPLTVIRGRLEGMVDGVYAADEAHIATALESTYLLERLVDDLRLLTLAETRQLHFEHHPLNLTELARRTTELFEAEAAEKKITLTVEEEAALLPFVGDAQRIEQVIANLVGNALRYTPPGGCVTLKVEGTPAGVALWVSDTGPGIPEEDLPHIFDRFWRGEKSRSRLGGGAGLGLAIARQLVEAQGGKIRASNRPEGGLLIGFEFPKSPTP